MSEHDDFHMQLSPSATWTKKIDVATRAYHLYLARGAQHGRDLQDWLDAERELRRVTDSLRAEVLALLGHEEVEAEAVDGVPKPGGSELVEALELLAWGPLNVLIIGPEPQAESAVQDIASQLRVPVSRWAPRASRDIPSDVTGALVVQNVDTCDFEQQQRLLAWTTSAPAKPIFSTAATPLFALVEAGRFLPALYYRLNVMLVCFAP
jgi:Protein of unknown function (DUF2934)